MQRGTTRGASLLALGLTVVGVVLLLNNFLLLSGFNVTAFWPLLLVVAGLIILFQGDITNNSAGRTFGITRGTVESASVEVSAGEIDLHLRGLAREGRLVAGQYAANSRPALDVRETHATLRMERSATPWLSFSDWELNLAYDLPWQVHVTTSLGSVNAELHEVIVQDALIATGIGDIRLATPREAFAPLVLRSAVGDIHVYTPPGARAVITVQPSPWSTVHMDENRYEKLDENVYSARSADSRSPSVEVRVRSTFGDLYLA